MAVASDYNRHPDEVNHFEAASYYTSHFLPPEIGNPEAVASYSPYGVSYLNYHWAEYFFAGKFMSVIAPIVQNRLLAARLFNVFLFAVLAGFFFRRSAVSREEFIIPSFLLITPQIWYVFSYVNNDAFALFISTLIVFQVASPRSLFNRFLGAEDLRENLFGGAWFGLLAGLLLISKPNFWTVLIFVALWILTAGALTARKLKKLLFIFVIAMAVLGSRVALDVYVNGESNFVGFSYVQKFFGNVETGRLLAYQEQVAEYQYRPSTIDNDLQNSHKGLKLKDKGVTFAELFTVWNWHGSSFNSFVGLYNYMNVWAPNWYYKSMLLLYIAFGGCVIFFTAVSRDRQSIIQLAILVLSILLTIIVSVMLSWLYAFQAQGRYLFPIISMVGLFVYANRRHFNNLLMHIFLFAAFLMSVYSFVFIGLAQINSK